jgi:hypothetical protein
MIYSSPTVNLAAFILICLAVLAAPIYAGWVFGGWIADRGEKNLFHRITRLSATA